jgi:hypothetical protein
MGWFKNNWEQTISRYIRNTLQEMLAKILIVAALAAVAAASIPITTKSLSMTQRIAALQGTKECVPCEEAMGHAIHTAAEAGNSPFLRACWLRDLFH